MKDEHKTKRQLLDELKELRREIAQQSASRPEAAGGPDAEENFRALAENANDGILISQEDGRYVYANRRAAKITGYAVSELLRQTIAGLTHKDHMAAVLERQRRRLSGKPAPRQYETVIVRKDGTPLPIELTAARTIWHGRPAGLAIIRDISRRKQAEEERTSALRERADIADAIGDAIIIFDMAGKIIDVNPAHERLTGLKRKDIVGKDGLEVARQTVKTEEQKKIAAAFGKVLKGKSLPRIQTVMVNRKGQETPVLLTVSMIKDIGGQPKNLIVVIKDIAHLEEAGKALKDSEQLYRITVDAMEDPLHLVDRQLKIVLANKAFKRRARQIGIKKGLVGREVFEVFPFLGEQVRKEYQQVFQTGKPVQTVEKIRIGSQEYISETRKIPIFEDGHVVRVATIVHDISEQKRIEEELRAHRQNLQNIVDERTAEITRINRRLIDEIKERERTEQEQRRSKEYLDGIINAFDDPVFVKDRKHRWVLLNDAACAMLGHSRGDLIGKSDYDFLPKEQADVFWKIDNLVFQTGKPNVNDEEITWRGQIRTISTKKSLFVDSTTGKKYIAGIIRDITQRKQTELALTEAKDRLQILFDFAPEAYFLTDEYGRLTEANKATEEISGYDKEELVGRTMAELGLLSPEDLSMAEDLRMKNLRGLDAGLTEFTFVRKDKSTRSIEISSHPLRIGGRISILNIARNVTARKRQEEQLAESAELFRSTFEQAAVGITHVALDGRFLRANQKFCDIVGYGRDDLLRRRFQDITHPLDLQTNLEFRRRLLSGEMSQLTMEKRYIHKDGYPVWVHLTCTLHCDHSGKPDYFISVTEDIGVDKWREEETIRSEERLKIIFEFAPDAYLQLDLQGNIVDCNKKAQELSGYSKAELKGKNMLTSHFLPQEQVAKATAFFEELALGRPMGPQEFTLIRKDAAKLSVEVSAFPVEIQGQTQILFIARNITEQKKRALRQKVKVQILDQLRKSPGIEDCLQAGCQAICDAGLYQRAVLTLHNRKREITHLGQVGLDPRTVERARKASPPDEALTKRMTDKRYRISHSYFIPAEASLPFKDTARYIPQKSDPSDSADAWRSGDELFVPLVGKDGAIEGYLSVDTPGDGKRPDLETILYLEDVVDIIARQVHEIQHMEILLESVETTRALMNATTDSAILSDHQGRIIALNQVAAERFKKPLKELIGAFGVDLVPPDLAKDRARRLKQVFRTKQPVRFRDRRGDIFFDTIMYPIRDVHGKVTRVAVFGRDITAEVRAREALESSERRYRELVELLPQTIFEVDVKGNLLSSNRAGFELTGYAQADIDRGLNVLQLFTPEDRQRARRNIAKALRGQKFEDHEYALLTKSGRLVPALIYSSRMVSDKKTIGLRGVVLDISALKRQEEKLRESEALARMFLDAYQDPAVLIDPQGIILDVNSYMAKRLSQSKEKLIGTEIFAYFEPESARLRKDRTQEAVRSRKPVHFEEERRGTSFETTVYPVVDTGGRVHRLAIFARDITERKHLEKELRSSEEKFRDLAENMPDIIYQIDPEGRITYISPSARKVIGYRPQECIGRMFHAFVNRKDIPATIVELNKVLRGHSVRIPMLGLKGKDGSTVSVMISSTPILKDGRVVGAQGIISDIGEHIRSDEAVQASEEKYRTIVELAPDAIVTADMRGYITSCNNVFLRQFGLRESDILDRHFTESPVMPKEHRNKYRQLFASLMRGPEPKKPIAVEWIDPKGSKRHTEMHVGFLRVGRKRTGFQAILRDVTAQRKIEEDLRQSEMTYRSLVELAPDSIVTFDLKGVITSCNTAALKVLGWTSRKRLIGKDFSQLPHVQKADISKLKALFAAVIAGQEVPPVEFATRRKDGTLRWAEGRYSRLKEGDKVTGVLGIIRDITEHKRQETIQQSICRISEAAHSAQDLPDLYRAIHQELSAVLPAKNMAISLYDREKNLLLLEYHRDEKDRFEKCVPAAKTITAHMMRSKRPLLLTSREIRRMRRDGQVRPIGAPVKAWLGTPLKFERWTIGALVLTDYRSENAFDHNDVQLLETISYQIALAIDRKRAQERLKGSEELFRNLAEHSPHMIYVNKMGPILFSNKLCEEIFGYSRKHYYSPDFDFLTLVAPESRTLIKEKYQQHRQGQEVPPYECLFLTKGGKKIKLHCQTQLITYQGEPAIFGILSQMP